MVVDNPPQPSYHLIVCVSVAVFVSDATAMCPGSVCVSVCISVCVSGV